MSPRLWGTEFPIPDAPTNLTSTWSDETSWLELDWDAWPGDPDVFDHWEIYRQIGNGDLVRIDNGTQTDGDVPKFTDSEAPVGVSLLYGVLAATGAYQSQTVTVIDLIDVPGWFIGVPGDETHSFKVRYVVPTPSRNARTSKTVRYPLGRSTPVITSGPVRKASGTLTVEIRLTYHSQVRLLREIEEYAADNPYIVLKNTDGEAFRAQIDGWTEQLSTQLLTQMSCNWWAIS